MSITVKIEIDNEKCVLCKLCVEYCPSGVFTMENKKLAVNESRCVECYGCIPLCPTSAIRIKVLDESTLRNFAEK
ncbi:MAG: 4Fe-4S binding protein [Desulfurococcaceae archaeon]